MKEGNPEVAVVGAVRTEAGLSMPCAALAGERDRRRRRGGVQARAQARRTAAACGGTPLPAGVDHGAHRPAA